MRRGRRWCRGRGEWIGFVAGSMGSDTCEVLKCDSDYYFRDERVVGAEFVDLVEVEFVALLSDCTLPIAHVPCPGPTIYPTTGDEDQIP